jgi:glycerol-3-phosphate acyltransferase PlsY
MMTGKEICLVLASYLVGCFTAGYYWVRWRAGQDIRQMGSGSVGARNVGRMVGWSGFVATFLLDFGKGLLAVVAARFYETGPIAAIGVMLAVVVGHIWPAQLRFHGGKGIATSLGALLAYDFWLVLIVAALFLPIWALARSFTLSGLLAFALAPLVIYGADMAQTNVVGMSLLALLVLVSHRKNIREEIVRELPPRPAKPSPVQTHKGPPS